jgi:hypothetical protein
MLSLVFTKMRLVLIWTWQKRLAGIWQQDREIWVGKLLTMITAYSSTC